MTGRMNWDRESKRARLDRAESQAISGDVVAGFRTLSFYLRERDMDTRFVIAIPYDWERMTVEQLIPYYQAHRHGSCKALRALKDANWCRISSATAESVGMRECELCSPYSNH